MPSTAPARSTTRSTTLGDNAAPDVRPDEGRMQVAGPPVLRAPVTYQPILDVARGEAAGFQARSGEWDPNVASEVRALTTSRLVREALSAVSSLPTNTFMSIPIEADVLTSVVVRSALASYGTEHGVTGLAGVVLDIVAFSSAEPPGELEDAVGEYRSRGALISVGGYGAAQPELTSIVRLKPAIIRLGRDWVRGIDVSEAKRSAIEITGRLAGQLDAWVLAEGVTSAAELRSLAGLAVPLAQGTFIGSAHAHWPDVLASARTALPSTPADGTGDGVLRSLLQQTYTATNAAAAAAVLPETTGFELLVVVDEHHRATSMLAIDQFGSWDTTDVLAVNVDTSVPDAVSRAMARPRPTRFTPLVCTDNAGRVLGILPIDRLMSHLADLSTPVS